MHRYCYRDADRHDGDEADPTTRSDVHRAAKYFGAPPVHHADQRSLRGDTTDTIRRAVATRIRFSGPLNLQGPHWQAVEDYLFPS
jgi:hypothetical protein